MKQKKIWIALLLLAAMLLTACGQYTPAAIPGGDHRPTGPEDLGGGPSGAPQEGPWTVTLTYQGEVYTKPVDVPITVQWSDGFSVHSAEMKDGVASIEGLDDAYPYTVSLSHVPVGFVYNPNGHVAKTDDRHVVIEMAKPVRTAKSGSNLYTDIIQITKPGTYQTTLTSASKTVYYQFAPQEKGTYVIESWVNTTENNVNPIMEVYTGTFANKVYQGLLDDGSYASTYTKNFKRDFSIDGDEIGNVYPFGVKATAKDGVYPVTVCFNVYCADPDYTRDRIVSTMVIPAERLYRAAEYDKALYSFDGLEIAEGTNKVFKGDMVALWERGTGMPMVSLTEGRGSSLPDQFTGEWELTFVNPKDGRTVYRKLTFEPSDAWNGRVTILQVDNPDIPAKRTEKTGIYSYTVCANHHFVSETDMDCEHCGKTRTSATDMPTPNVDLRWYVLSTEVDFAGLSVTRSGELRFGTGDGYYHFYDSENGTYGEILYAKISQPCRFYDTALSAIEYAGNKNLTVNSGTENYKFFIEGFSILSMGYFCVRHRENNVYCPCLSTCGGACHAGCEKCHSQCTPAPEALFTSSGGYADYANSDGVCAVTQELKEFLQKFSVSQLLFFDGNGFVETHPSIKIYSGENEQWMFACGYYREK